VRRIGLLFGLLLLIGYISFWNIGNTADQDKSVVVGFTGDVMIGRLVSDVIKQKGYQYIWGDMLPVLKKNDFNLINFETTLTKSDKAVPKVFNFKSDPDNVQALVEASIDVVSLANNHAGDFGDEGLLETLEILDRAGIKYVGAEKNIDKARKPVILEKYGIKIGIIGLTDNEPDWLAHSNKPGTNYFKVGDLKTVKKSIELVRDKVDVVVASLHWGPNKRIRPTQEFIDFAHAMIDAGVDVIHGHSAHITQGIEVYRGKLIMYDTGDFIDDYMVGPRLRNDQSFLFNVHINKKGPHKLELIPVLISNMQVNKATGSDKKEVTEWIKKLSGSFGTIFEEKKEKLVLTIK